MSRVLAAGLDRRRCATRRTCAVLLLLASGLPGCSERAAPVALPPPDSPQVLRRGLGAEPATFDPQLAEDNAALAVAAELYEGLTRVGLDGILQPGAAESWEPSADGLAWSFRLRDGLRWSDGEPLQARHYAEALQALVAADSIAPFAALYSAIESIEATGPRELRLRLHQPLPHLPALLALPAASPRHPSGGQPDRRPGNGPFRLLERRAGESLLLERNPHYWDAARVSLDRVRYLTLQDIGTELRLYESGEIDITSEVPNTHFGSLRAKRPQELHSAPYLAVYAYAVNLQRLPDREARLALAMAVDRERITRQVTGAGELPAYGWVPDGFPGYEPARFDWARDESDAAQSESQRLWRAAAVRGGAPRHLTLCTDASANHHRTAVALADLWRRALGVDTRIVELEWGVYLDTRRNPGDCDLLRLGWSADFLDPEAFAGVFESGSPQNTLGYRSARYDRLLGDSRLALDPGERLRLLTAAEAQLLEDVPVIPLFFRVSKRLVQPGVQGYVANPLGQLPSRDLALRRR